MRIYLLLLILVTSFKLVNSQEYYDLIVNSNGDSLACHIDSITDSHIYFEMKYNGEWIHTHKKINEVVEYKENILEKESIYLKPGTSYMLRLDQLHSRPVNNFNIGVYGDFSLILIQYEMLFFINSNLFLAGKLGIGYNVEYKLMSDQTPKTYTSFSYNITGNINLSKEKYYLLLGIGGTLISGDINQEYLLYPIIGFRSQPLKICKFNFSPYIYIPLSSTKELLELDFVNVPDPFGVGINLGISF